MFSSNRGARSADGDSLRPSVRPSARVGRLRRGRGTGLRPAPSPVWTSDPSRMNRSLANREGRAEGKKKSTEGSLELRRHSTDRMRTKLESSSAQKILFFAFFFSFFPLFLLFAAWGKKSLAVTRVTKKKTKQNIFVHGSNFAFFRRSCIATKNYCHLGNSYACSFN